MKRIALITLAFIIGSIVCSVSLSEEKQQTCTKNQLAIVMDTTKIHDQIVKTRLYLSPRIAIAMKHYKVSKIDKDNPLVKNLKREICNENNKVNCGDNCDCPYLVKFSGDTVNGVMCIPCNTNSQIMKFLLCSE